MIKNNGITLIEILVSLLVLAIIIGPFTGMFVQSSRINNTVKEQLNITYIVRNEMEILMSKDAPQIYMSNGIKNEDDIFIRTTVKPYTPNTGTRSFNIIVKSLAGIGDEIMIYTPSEYRPFLLDGDNESCFIDINIDAWSFNIAVDNLSISEEFSSPGRTSLEINLIAKESLNHLNFNVDGDIEIKVYPGNDDNWNLTFDKAYTIMDKCFYKDYLIFWVKIEAFKDQDLYKPIFEIENIIRAPN